MILPRKLLGPDLRRDRPLGGALEGLPREPRDGAGESSPALLAIVLWPLLLLGVDLHIK